MKLSNKILTGFFGVIFIYLTAAFTEVRFRGTPKLIGDSNSIAETVDISKVNYLILSDLERSIRVYESDNPRLEVRSLSGNLLKKVKYTIKGDTLSLSQPDLEDHERLRISVYVSSHSFKGLTANGTSIFIEGLDQQELTISQNASWVTINESNKLSKLQLKATNKANFTMTDNALDTLFVLIDESQVTIEAPVKLVEGSMANDSYLRLRGTSEIKFKKDETSRLYLD